MFNAADILVDGTPVIDFVAVEGLSGIMRVGIAHVVPARTNERIHGICLAMSMPAAFRASAFVKSFARRHRTQCALLKLHIFGKFDGQIFFGYKDFAAFVAVLPSLRVTVYAFGVNFA